MKIAVYPGSFDPITNGHLDILNRALKIFDKVIVLVAYNPNKKSRFDVIKRVQFIKEATKDYPNVSVDSYDGLSLDYAKKVGAVALVRGIRPVSDFDYEFQLSASNEFINKDIDMVFFMAHKDTTFISSSSIMEMHDAGVDISALVPSSVYNLLKK